MGYWYHKKKLLLFILQAPEFERRQNLPPAPRPQDPVEAFAALPPQLADLAQNSDLGFTGPRAPASQVIIKTMSDFSIAETQEYRKLKFQQNSTFADNVHFLMIFILYLQQTCL